MSIYQVFTWQKNVPTKSLGFILGVALIFTVSTYASAEIIPGEAAISAPGVAPVREEATVTHSAPLAGPAEELQDAGPATPEALLQPEIPASLGASMNRAKDLVEASIADWPISQDLSGLQLQDVNSQGIADAMAQSEDPQMQQRALEANQSMSPDELQPAWEALRSPDIGYRDAAITYLQDAPGKLLLEFLFYYLGGPDGAQWAQVLEEPMADLQTPLEPVLLATLKGTDSSLMEQRIAVWALGRMGSLESLPLLTDGAWSLEDALVEESVYALEFLRSTSTIPAWAELTQHELYDVRAIAVKNLCTLGGPEAFDALAAIGLGKIPVDPPLQLEAVRGLTQWPAEEIMPILLEIMEVNRNVRKPIGNYLRNLTGAKLPDMPAQWQVYFYGSPEAVPDMRDTPQPGQTGNQLLDNVPLVPPGFVPGP